MTVNDILNYNNIIKGIIDNTKEVNALVKFKLLGMCKQFEPIVENFETVRQEKIAQYGTKDENGNIGIFSPNKDDFKDDKDYDKALYEYQKTISNFTNAIDEVLNSDADTTIKKFKYSEIMDAGIPSDYLIAIYDLIEEWLEVFK